MPAAGPSADVAIHGRLDGTTEADLRAELMAVLDAVPVETAPVETAPVETAPVEERDFVVDLSGVTTVDVVGVGLLAGVHRQVRRRDRRLVLTGVPPRVMRLLVVTRLRAVLTVRDVPRATSEQPGARIVGAA